MPKINQEEYEVLKEAQEEGYKWIARNYNGALIIYTSKPMKNPNLYWDGFGKRMDDRLFQFIQWEDEEPYEIAELIEEYLYDNQPKLFIDGQEQSFEFIEESEEKEVKKDIEWVKDKLKRLKKHDLEMWKQSEPNSKSQSHFNGSMSAIDKALDFLDQLDEPEVLSQKWIDDNKKDSGVHYIGYYVPIGRLHDLLVPKQELPVIPQFVADWVESRDYCNVYKVLQDLSAPGSPHASKDVRNWIFRNQENVEKFVRAWLDGYEVEEEPQYRLKAGENYLYFNLDGTVRGATKDNATITKERLEQLPFDVEKAVESGIIEVEELEEC